MDQESIVYGCIKDIAACNDDPRREVNRAAMAALPSAEDWPFLSREMFSIPPKACGFSNSYHTEVLHFGSSYKAIEYEWEQWIGKFEELLSQMYWVSATVHLETEMSGSHTFTWESSANFHIPNSGDMQVRCEWQHDRVF